MKKIFISIKIQKFKKGGGANFCIFFRKLFKKFKIKTNYFLSEIYLLNSFPFNSPLGFFLILIKAKHF